MLPRILFSLPWLSVLALTASAEPNYYMLSGGWNFSSFVLDLPQGTQYPKQGYRQGLGLTAGIQVHPRTNVAVATGLGYETRGATWTSNGTQRVLKFDYLHVPLSLKLMGPPWFIQPYLAPGLELAYLVASNSDGKQTIKDPSGFDLDVGAALGLHIPMGDNAIFLETGYAYGLMNASGGNDDGRTTNNSAFKFRLGVLKEW